MAAVWYKGTCLQSGAEGRLCFSQLCAGLLCALGQATTPLWAYVSSLLSEGAEMDDY